jgi:F-type H+-transporting ATPase subunit b
MFVFISSLIFFVTESAHAAEGGFTKFYDEYLDIQGFEAWKFINLAIFVAVMIYLLKKPLSAAFKTKREAIRAELVRAEEEKQTALARLTVAEGKLAQLVTEKANVLQKAKDEAAVEKKRLDDLTYLDSGRLRQQAHAELARIGSQSRAELRRFSAVESIRLAEEKLRAQIDGDIDARLVMANIQAIGGLN